MILVYDPVCQAVKLDIFIIYDSSDDYEVEHDVVVFPNDEQKEVNQFVELGRKSLNCTDQQFLYGHILGYTQCKISSVKYTNK